MREVTERQEGVDAGTAKLVGTDKEVIIRELVTLLSDKVAYEKMAKAVNPYGDGTTCKQIADIILKIKSKTRSNHLLRRYCSPVKRKLL